MDIDDNLNIMYNFQNNCMNFCDPNDRSKPYDYITQNNVDETDESDERNFKKSKLNDERALRSRERNRIHARNTRERKRAQMDLLQQRIYELSDEKKRLENYEPESSVASILMSLSNNSNQNPTNKAVSKETQSNNSRNFAFEAIENLKTQISAELSDEEELDISNELLMKEKSLCSSTELEIIRRERNRMHAKKTRLRKKRMLSEMETIIFGLEEEITRIRVQKGLLSDSSVLISSYSKEKLSTKQQIPIINTLPYSNGNSSRFTGFRHSNKNECFPIPSYPNCMSSGNNYFDHTVYSENKFAPLHPELANTIRKVSSTTSSEGSMLSNYRSLSTYPIDYATNYLQIAHQSGMYSNNYIDAAALNLNNTLWLQNNQNACEGYSVNAVSRSNNSSSNKNSSGNRSQSSNSTNSKDNDQVASCSISSNSSEHE